MMRWLVFLATLVVPSLQAQQFQTIDEGPLHEAYVQKVTDAVVLDSVPSAPPPEVQETIPPQRDPQALWINGYWDYDEEMQDFYWVTGTWRRPPPGRTWVPGQWLNSDEGWARVSGFWTAAPINTLAYNDVPPPDPIDEDAANPPGPDAFWLPGYWAFSGGQYEWLQGEWRPFDPNWVMVPAHYVWRPEGYLLVESYWDWPLDERGEAYPPIAVPPGPRVGLVYAPAVIIQPVVIVERLFPYYPDYSCFYHHHYHYHQPYWNGFYGTPPWWGWSGWWSYSWSNCWGLWWWYSHPGYPAPHWMNHAMSQKIAPPHNKFYGLFKKVQPPVIVTPKGVVKPSKIYDALGKADGKGKGKGKFKPILPSGKKGLDKIRIAAEPKEEGNKLKPEGKKGEKPLPKPVIDKDAIKNVKKGGKGVSPKTPSITLPKKDLKQDREILKDKGPGKFQEKKDEIKKIAPPIRQKGEDRDGGKKQIILPKDGEGKPIPREPQKQQVIPQEQPKRQFIPQETPKEQLKQQKFVPQEQPKQQKFVPQEQPQRQVIPQEQPKRQFIPQDQPKQPKIIKQDQQQMMPKESPMKMGPPPGSGPKDRDRGDVQKEIKERFRDDDDKKGTGRDL